MLPPTQFQTVKQPKDSYLCGACVAAMLVGESLEQVLPSLRASEDEEGVFYSTCEVVSYLGYRGISCGLTIGFNEEVVVTPTTIIQYSPFTLEDKIAILMTTTLRGSCHMVLWDGSSVRDPSPKQPEVSELEGYRISQILLVTYVKNHGV